MIRSRLLSGLVVLLSCAATAQSQTKISQLPPLATDAAPLTDALPAVSAACAGGNCKETVGQILGALASGNVNQSITSSTQIVIAPTGKIPQLAPVSALIPLLGSGGTGTGAVPFPSTTSLGGILATSGATHKWISAITPSGEPTLSQPSASDISGLGSAATYNAGTSGTVIPLLSGTNTWGGTQTFGAINASAIYLNGVALGTTSGGGGSNGTAAITGGTINGTTIGMTTPEPAEFTSLSAQSLTLPGTIIHASTGQHAYTGDTYQALIAANNAQSANVLYNATGGGGSNADAVRVTQMAVAGQSTANTNAVGAYVDNWAPTTGPGSNSVAFYGIGLSQVNNAYTWGINTVLDDISSSRSGAGLFNEFDFNVTSPTTIVNGLAISGLFSTQPNNANGFVLTSTNPGPRWNNGFYSANNAAITGLLLGTGGSPTSANVNSQPIAFVMTDANATQNVLELVATQHGIYSTWPLIPPAYMSANLPPCTAAAIGSLAIAIDVSNPQNGQPVTSGGSAHRLVMCDGYGAWNIE